MKGEVSMKRGTGIVVEVASQDQVIIMTSQGEFVQVPFTKPVCVGQEIHYQTKRTPVFWKWSVVAVLFVVIVGAAGQINEIPGGLNPAFIVTLDINPSIELAINLEQRVVSAEGLNADGRNLLKKLNLIGRNFKNAIEIIEGQAAVDGYLREGEKEIVVTISREGIDDYELVPLESRVASESISLEHKIGDVIKEAFAVGYDVIVWKVPVNMRSIVREQGTTPAKYIAVNFHESTVSQAAYTPVATTVDRDGDYHYFEFEVTRPVLTPVAITQANSKE